MNAKPANLPLSSIQPSPFGERTADAGLVASVRENGILHPVGVIPDGTGGYRLAFGARRLDAARKAGLTAIPARVFPADTDPQTARVMFLAENVQRLAADPLAEADCLAELVAVIPESEAARRLGRPLSWVQTRLHLATLPKQAKAMLAEVGEFSVSAVALLSRLPAPALMAVLEGDALALTSVDAAQDAIRAAGHALADAPFDTLAECAGCNKRTGAHPDGNGGPDLCLDGDCYAEKVWSAAGVGIARIRKAHPMAPVVVSPAANDFATPADRDLYNRHGAEPLKDKRLAEPGEDGDPGILLDGGRPRLVRLVPAPHRRDGRAMRNDPNHPAALAASRLAHAVAEKLRLRIAEGERPVGEADFPALCVALASAVAGLDLDPSAAFHVLLAACAGQLRRNLTIPAFSAAPEALRGVARKVMGLISADPDRDLAALEE
ncbi:MAG: ParB/RepB/Spo0J family partition protein [Kiritimatiellae bacterium]|nr:ParB/RepB/Spo0J family partition protein [Kiritimatiellia bacterium]